MTRKDLEPFFSPKSIAVVGASRTPGKIGHEILRNIKLSGYKGEVYPINAHAKEILGFQSYRSLDDLDSGSIDLAIVVIPAGNVEDMMLACTRKKVPAAIIISSGFSEVGNKELEEKIVKIAKQGGTRLVGPNTFGIFYSKSKMNATFGPNYVLSGKTAFITQSGALGLALMDWTTEEKYGVSSIVSIGNKCDVDDADLVDFFAEDNGTGSILIYMEGLKDGRKFYEATAIAAKRKPIVIIKSGTSKRGAQAASSHTGSIAGEDLIYSTAFRQAGAMRAETMTQAFDWIQAINENPIPRGENIVIMTNGGGIGVLATDKCEQVGLKLMDLPDSLKEQIQPLVPGFGSVRNPVDMTANADDEVYRKVVTTLFRSDEVHCIIALFCQTANIDPMLVAHALLTAKNQNANPKPITVAIIGGRQAQAAYTRLIEQKFAAYPTAERAVDGMFALITRYREIQRKQGG